MKVSLSETAKRFAPLLVVFHLIVAPAAYSAEGDAGEVSELLVQANDFKAAGYYSKAIPYIEKVLAIQRGASEGTKAEVAESLDQLGELYYLAGKYKEAEPPLAESLAIRQEVFGPDHIETTESYNLLGVFYTFVWENDKAGGFLKNAITIREKTYGVDHPETAQSLLNLARLRLSTDNLDEAETLLKQVLAIQEKLLGPEHPDLVRTLNTLAWLHIDSDDFEKAEPFSTRALAISEKVFEPEHPYVADSLNYLGRLYYSRRDYEKSISTAKRALAMQEKFLGPDHPDVGVSLNNLALPYSGLEDYETAKSLLMKSLAVREKSFGPEHQSLLIVLQNAAWVHEQTGDYARAVSLYERSLAISEKVYGPDSTEVADRRQDVAGAYYALGDYQKSEASLLLTLKFYEKTLGPDHPKVASNLSDLAMVCQSKGDFERAEKMYKRAIEIREKNYEKVPTNLSTSLSKLADFYVDVGQYEKAASYYNRALKITEEKSGPDDSSTAYVLNKMGHLYANLADYKRAESLFKRSLAIWENNYGPDHPHVASAADNLAMLYEATGDYKKAEPLLKRALQIRQNIFEPNHPNISQTHNNLAALYALMEDYAKAEELYQQVLKAKAETAGAENYSYANSLHNLALVCAKSRNYEEAAKLYSQAIEIWQKTLGPDHPSVSRGYGNLSLLYADMGDFEKAYGSIVRSLEIDNRLIDQVLGFTSENRKLQFVVRNNWALHHYFNLVKEKYSQDPIKIKRALDLWLKRKGLLLEADRRYQNAASSAGDPESARLVQELNDVRASLSKLIFAQPGERSAESYKQKTDKLEEEKDRLEDQLSRLNQPFALRHKISKADSGKVAGTIPPGSVLVEFARINTIKIGGTDKENLADQYIAFMLPAGDGGRVSMIGLGDAGQIDGLIAQYRGKISRPGNKNRQSVSSTSKKLYELLFEPLQKNIGPAKEIFISPDGSLNLIPFEVLQQPDGRFLIEDYTFNYIASGRDILGFEGTAGGGKYLLMGAPDFDLGLDEKQVALDAINIKDDIGQQPAMRSANLNEVSFEPLRHAKEELEAIGGILGGDTSEIYTGKHALEEILRAESGHEIVHLATHGFFLADQELPGEGKGWQAADMLIEGDNQPVRIQTGVNAENPLLRSGILLAGARRSLMTGDTGKNDGIVTAEKILGLNLHPTKMVVLSACDTGLGEIKNGQAVFGLRRAFTRAGAKSLVMSLWKAPAPETKELMVNFYMNIQSGKMNRCQALRQAALEQMKIVEKRHGHANPRYWGAFVFIGEP